MADLSQTKITAKEFFEMYDETMEHIELIDGEVVVSPAPLLIHQKILRKITVAFSLIVDAQESGELVMAPNDVKFSEIDTVQPDLFFVSKANSRCKLAGKYWDGVPDFCVEVLSPGTQRADRIRKFSLYEKHGVREYWIVDPENKFIEVYVLENNRFQRKGIYTETDTLTSVVLPEVSIELSRIFAG